MFRSSSLFFFSFSSGTSELILPFFLPLPPGLSHDRFTSASRFLPVLIPQLFVSSLCLSLSLCFSFSHTHRSYTHTHTSAAHYPIYNLFIGERKRAPGLSSAEANLTAHKTPFSFVPSKNPQKNLKDEHLLASRERNGPPPFYPPPSGFGSRSRRSSS